MKNNTILLLLAFGVLLIPLGSKAQAQQSNAEPQTEHVAVKLVLTVEGMSCQPGCADGIDKVLKKQEGIVKSKTTFATGSSEILYNKELISEKEIVHLIKDRGFKAIVKKDDQRRTDE